VKALQGVMRYVWQRAGLGEKFSGTHILRHSIATRMRQKGVGLKSIADVLGHQSMQTTTLYAQVDLPALRAVAQPWLEVRP
jgi:site-specific recombinase XerD